MLKVTAYLFFGLIITIIIYANMGWDLFLFKWLKFIPFKDKAGHFLLTGGFAFFVNILLKTKRVEIFNKRVLLGSLIVFTLMTIEEGSQYFIISRTCDWVDLMCNYAGILLIGRLAEKVSDEK